MQNGLKVGLKPRSTKNRLRIGENDFSVGSLVVLNTTVNCSSSTHSCALGVFSTGASAPTTEGGCYVEVVSRSQGLGPSDLPVQPDDPRSV